MSRLTACAKAATLLCAGLAVFLSQPNSAVAFDRNQAQLFGVLPDGAKLPEGLTVAPNGDVYVATFDGSNKIVVFNQNGKLLRTITVTSASGAGFLGIAFHPHTGAFLVIDFGGGTVLNVDKNTGTASVFMTSPNGTASGLNALAFDRDGNVYVSDSFGGIIWRTGPNGGAVTNWAQNDLLKTAGDPPFGANGLAFNKAQDIMFVANTGNDTIVQIPVTHGMNGATAGTPAIFTNSINGADGLIIDDQDNLWVCANQSDEIVVVDKTGKVIAKLGDFDGLVDDGTPKGLLFPATPFFSRDKKTVYVTNLALDLRVGTKNPANIAVDSAWAARVKHWTVSKISTQFQPLPDK